MPRSGIAPARKRSRAEQAALGVAGAGGSERIARGGARQLDARLCPVDVPDGRLGENQIAKQLAPSLHDALAFAVELDGARRADRAGEHLAQPTALDRAGEADQGLRLLPARSRFDLDGDEQLRLAYRAALVELHTGSAHHDAASGAGGATADDAIGEAGQDAAQQGFLGRTRQVLERPLRRRARARELTPDAVDRAQGARVEAQGPADVGGEAGARRFAEEPGALEQVGRSGRPAALRGGAEGALLQADVALRRQGGEQRPLAAAAAGLRLDEQARQPRRRRHHQHAAADVGQLAALLVHGAEQAEQPFGAPHRAGARRIQPPEPRHLAQAPGAQLEQHGAQLETADLRNLALESLGVLRGRPQTQTTPRGGAPRASGALLGGGSTDRGHPQRVDPVARVEAGDARQAGVDDAGHSLDRQRRLGDVGRQHDLAARSGPQHPLLRVERQVAVQGQNGEPLLARQWIQRLGGTPDFRRAGQEDEDVAVVLGQKAAHGGEHASGKGAVVGALVVLDLAPERSGLPRSGPGNRPGTRRRARSPASPT